MTSLMDSCLQSNITNRSSPKAAKFICYSVGMKICVPIKEKRQKTVMKALKEAAKKADFAEIWIDQVQDLDLKAILSASRLPLLIVCKRPDEKGAFKGSYKALAERLIEASSLGAKYIDIPLRMPENLNKKIVQT